MYVLWTNKILILLSGLVFCCYVEIMIMSSNNNNFFLPLFTVLFRKFCRHLLLDNTERRPVPVREPGNVEHTAESPHHHVLDADPRHPHLLLPPSLRALLRDTGVHAPPRHSGHHWYLRGQVYSNTNFLSMVPKIYSNSKQFVNTRRILHKFQFLRLLWSKQMPSADQITQFRLNRRTYSHLAWIHPIRRYNKCISIICG